MEDGFLKIPGFRYLFLEGYETCSVALTEEHWLRAPENMVLREVFGPNRDELTGQWRSFMVCIVHKILLA